MKQDRRFLRTQSLLNGAILSLIKERAIVDISVEDIAGQAGIARKTFYAHYANKYELLWHCLHELYQAIISGMDPLDPDSVLAGNKPLSYPAFAHVKEYAIFYRGLFEEGDQNTTLLRIWQGIAEASYASHAPLRAIAPQITVEPELMAQMLAGAFLGAVRWWLAEDLATPPETMAYRFSQVMAPGVLGALGLDF